MSGRVSCFGCEAHDQRSSEIEQLRVELRAKDELIAELKADKERLDWAADDRICDGIGGVDIDDWVSEHMTGDSEEEWKLKWREGFRVAIDAARSAEPSNTQEKPVDAA